jgi:hypothetical protein
MKLVPFFFAFFLPSPDREAIRRMIKNAKTNNKASHREAFFIDNNKGNIYDRGKPITGAAR